MGLNPTASDWSVHMVSLVSGCVCGEKVARTGPKLVQPVEFFSAARRMAIGPFRFTENQLCQRTGRPPARRWSNLASGLTFSLFDGRGGGVGRLVTRVALVTFGVPSTFAHGKLPGFGSGSANIRPCPRYQTWQAWCMGCGTRPVAGGEDLRHSALNSC